MKNALPHLKFLFIFMTIIIYLQPAQAGKVVRVKGKKVYVLLSADESQSVKKGDILYLVTPNGKKKALIKVRAKKKNMVIAQLGKGKAKKGFLTKARSSKKRRKKRRRREEERIERAEEVAEVESDETTSGSDMMWGIMGGFGQVTQNIANVADTSGSSMAIKGLFDYEVFDQLGLRARAGIDMMSLTGAGTDSNDNSTINFSTDLTYMTLDLMLRYHLYRTSSLGIFVNGGMGIYMPLSSELAGVDTDGDPQTGAINPDSISTTSLLIFGGGVSFPVGSWELFIGGEYFFFANNSEDVESSAFGGKLGILFPL